MGTNLALEPAGAPTHPVVLHGGDEASGLADMLHQFLSQTLEDSTAKVHKARSLSGALLFHAAEDPRVCVRISFHDDRIELRDAVPDPGLPSMTADFLTTADLTTGAQGPFSLLVKRKVKVRLRITQVRFLLRVLALMKIESNARRWRLWTTVAILIAMTALAGWLLWR